MSPSDSIPDLDWPLMDNNITRADLDAVIEHLKQDNPRLTQGPEVVAFEKEWSEWLGVKHSVFVNSGSSANTITLLALREKFGPGEVIVPTLTWVSDIAAVLHAGMTPVFVDINPRTLGMDTAQVLNKLNSQTRAVFLTHILGYNALDEKLLHGLRERGIPLSRTSANRTEPRFRAAGSARSVMPRTSPSITRTISARSRAAWFAPTTRILPDGAHVPLARLGPGSE